MSGDASSEPPSKQRKLYTDEEDIEDYEYEEALVRLKEFGKQS